MRKKTTSIKGHSLVLRAVERLFRVTAAPVKAAVRRADSLTCGEWITRWMAERCPRRSSHSYRVLGQKWQGEIGDKQLSSLTVDDLRPLLHRLKRDGRSGATIHNYRSWVRTVLGDAVRDGLIDTNPALGFRRGEFPPKHPVREKGSFDPSEIGRVLEGTAGRLRVIFAVGCLTGARSGEILGSKIDSYVRTESPLPMFRIANAWRERLGELGPTKTDLVRDVPAHPVLSEVLEDWIDRGWRETYGRAPEPGDWLVPSAALNPLSSSTAREELYAALKRLGMRKRIVHDFCRTFCMLLRSAGAPRDLVKFLRHPRPHEVHDRYLLWPYPTLCAAVSAVDLTLTASSPQLELFPR